jgi:Protein  of unknown function (DUF3018)
MSVDVFRIQEPLYEARPSIKHLPPDAGCDRLHVTQEFVMAPKTTTSSRDKVRAHRARLRKQGLRPVQFWIPDMNSPAFIKEARRQSLAIANSDYEEDDQNFVDSISVWNNESDASSE